MKKVNAKTQELARQLANSWVTLRLYGTKQYTVENDPKTTFCDPVQTRVGAKVAAQALKIAAEMGATFKVEMCEARNSFLIYIGANEDASALDSLEEDIAPFSAIIGITCVKPIKAAQVTNEDGKPEFSITTEDEEALAVLG